MSEINKPAHLGPFPATYFHGQYDATSVTVTLCLALALYNAIELILMVLSSFQKWKGLYFWSLVVATFGVLMYCNGLLLEYYSISPKIVGPVIDSTGWCFMVTGQSVVLYSRLGILLNNRKILQAVKWMIIVDGFIFHITANVLNFGAHWTENPGFRSGYFYFEYIQMTGFCIQEFIISGLYLWKALKLLKSLEKTRSRRIMYELVIINVIIVILDIALLAIEYKNYHIFEQCVKAFVYSVKLKLEFAILGKMVDIVTDSQRTMSATLADVDSYVDQSSYRASLALEKTLSPRTRLEPIKSPTKASVTHIEDRENSTASESSQNDNSHRPFEKPLPDLSGRTKVDPDSVTRRRTSVVTADIDDDDDISYADMLKSISRT